MAQLCLQLLLTGSDYLAVLSEWPTKVGGIGPDFRQIWLRNFDRIHPGR